VASHSRQIDFGDYFLRGEPAAWAIGWYGGIPADLVA